jgi:hypothetical protein
MRVLSAVLLLCSVSALAQDLPQVSAVPALNTVIIVDNSVPLVSGRLEGLPLENAVAIRTEQGLGAEITLQPGQWLSSRGYSAVSVPMPMPTNNAGIAAGALGGALGNAMARSEALRYRQKEILAMQLAIPGLEMRQRFFTVLEREAARHGLQVSSTVAHGVPDQSMARVEFKRPEVQRVITVSRYGPSLISVSRDNATPVFLATLALYGRTATGMARLAQVDVVYVGHRAPGTMAPVEYWAQDKGSAYVAQVEQGAAAMMSALFNPAVSGAAPTPKRKGDDASAVRMLAVADGLAFAQMYESLVVIAPLPEAKP